MRWMQKFLAEWYGPMIEIGVVSMWERVPPQVKEQLKAADPAKYREFEEAVRRMGGTEGG